MPEKCFHCNGYYGSSFGQPLCPTCHMFLYDPPLHSTSIQCREKVDECDSGNEEPREPSECHVHNTSSGRTQSLTSNVSRDGNSSSDNDEMHENNIGPNLSLSQNNYSCDGSKYHGQRGLGGDEASAMMYEDDLNGMVAHDVENGMKQENSKTPIEESRKTPPSPHYSMSNSLQEMTLDWTGAREVSQDSEDGLNLTREPAENEVGHISRMPPEVLLLVFGLLDDFSLWSVGQVCRQWYDLVSSCTLNDHWKDLVQRRFPLFAPLYKVINWHKVFTFLIESAPCQMCLLRMPNTPIGSTNNQNSWRETRLSTELRNLKTDPPEGIAASPLDENSNHWQACIRGPLDSPYAGGTFLLYVEIPTNYPLIPPIVRFITRIFHPNVSRHGDIGIDSIQHNWSLALTISKILISIQSLLTDPYTEVCMEPRIGEMYDQNRAQFELIAQAWTWRYAMVDTLTPESLTAGFLQEVIMRRNADREDVRVK